MSNKPKTPQGPGWSPDGGAFWRRDGKIYWESGHVAPDFGMIRESPESIPESEWHLHEDYSSWSDRKRAAALAKTEAVQRKTERRERARLRAMKKLAASAKKKITREEFEAVQWSSASGVYRFVWGDLP